MNRTRAVSLGVALPAVVLGAALAVVPAQGSQGATPIVGTWRMSIDPRPNPAGDPPAFPSLVSFVRGGTMVDAVSSVPVPARKLGATVAGNGLGAWRQKGRTVEFAFDRFLTDGTGVMVARQHVEGTLRVSKGGATQAGPATATFFTPDGSVVAVVPIDASGSRMLP